MQDLLLDSNLDLQIANGDFVVGRSDEQHQELLLLSSKGSFKQFPTVGVGIDEFLEGEDPALMMREIRSQFTQDGMTITALNYDGTNLTIDASY